MRNLHLIIFPDHTKVESLDPPLSLITLQLASSAFSPEIKLPPYFKQYLPGFEVAIKTDNLHMPHFEPSKFRTCEHFNLTNINHDEKTKLKTLEPTPSIPIDQLRAQIDNFGQIDTE